MKLSQIADINASSIKKDFWHSKIQYVDISSVGTGTLEQTTELELSEAPSRAKRLVKNGSIIMATVRPNRRSFYYFKNPDDKIVVSTGFAVVDARENTDSRFLYYLLSSKNFTDYLVSRAKGAAYPAVDAEVFKNAELVLPPLEYQQKTASILAAFDDLIENNSRRIKILEQTAQLIYKKWFVNFRFPGHEDVKSGEIPAGWRKSTIGDIMVFNYGKALKASERENGNVLVYGSSGVVGTHNKALVPAPGIVVGRKGNVGSVFWVSNDFYPIDTTFFITTDLSLLYCYFLLKNEHFISGDAAVPGLNRNHAYSKKIVAPQSQILRNFEKIVGPIFSEVNALNWQNLKLAKIRDFLLPKLIKGTVNIR